MTLFNEIKKSNYVENILEASEFLHTKIESKETTVFDELIQINQKIQKFKNVNFGIIDIYFPSKIHKGKWKKDKNLLVAPTAETITNGRDFFPAYNLKGEKVNLSTQNLPEIPVLIITFSEKEGNYLDSPNPMPLQKINSPYVHFFRLNKLYIKHDYEGWFSGDMEIYFKIKKKEYTFGDYGSWYQINLGSLSSNQTKIYDPPVNIASSLTDEYYIKIEIWEDDGWGTGDDDFVADEHYNTALIGSYVANLWYNMGGVSEFRFADMGAYGNDIWAVDGITGSQDYDTITLTKYVVEQSAQ